MTQHSYHLQKYTGIASRYSCPECGRKRCFTLYIDETGTPLHETVGRCDHESSCGYHYTPKEYFHDHPDNLSHTVPMSHARTKLDSGTKPRKPQQQKPICTIPETIVTRSIKPGYHSQFTSFLLTILNPETVRSLILQYRIGVTKSQSVIFFQTDTKGRCRTGKIMKYDPVTGHRIKDQDTKGRITWVHSLMKQSRKLPQDWELTQCLFGEHLLPTATDKTVALVESEKTAIICAGIMPDYIWLATGGKSQLSPDRLAVLKGRKVIAFPDIDGFDTWLQKLSDTGLDITVSPILDQNATAEEREAHIDIADWLIEHRLHPKAETPQPALTPQEARSRRTFLKVAPYFSPEYHNEIKALIEGLDLVAY